MNINTLYNVCAVPWGVLSTVGMFSTVGDIMSTVGDILSTVGVFITVGVFSTVGDIMSTVGVILSTVGVFSTVGRYHDALGGYHEYRRGCSVPWGEFCYLSTPRHWTPQWYSNFKGWYPPAVLNTPTVLMISPHVHHDIPHGTQDNPPRYSWYPPWYWTPPRYSRYPPRYSRYPPRYSWYPPRYWTPSTVLSTPTVLHTHYTWWLMRRFVRHKFSFVPGFFGNRPVGSLMDSKMEDVINQSSNYNLKFRSIFILIQPNPTVPQRSKFWPPPIQTSSLIFMTVRTERVYFPTSFCLALQIDFSQCCVSAVGSLEIDLWQVYKKHCIKTVRQH